jgi:hypothetical protein
MVLQLQDYDAPHQNMICVLRYDNVKTVDKKENYRDLYAWRMSCPRRHRRLAIVLNHGIFINVFTGQFSHFVLVNTAMSLRSILINACLILPCLLLSSCTTNISYKQLRTSVSSPKYIAVFFDGTSNNEKSDTNIKRLHSLVSLQQRTDIASIYIEGVGTETDVIGMGTGFGIGPRVRIAYEFLLNNYNPGDKIYIFGFSRGAFSARILTSMLYHAGLPRLEGHDSHEAADMVFDAVKESIPREQERERKQRVATALHLAPEHLTPVSVDVLGLWDTVAALGAPSWPSRLMHKAGLRAHPVDIDIPNDRYGDQLCNVRQVYHALSIDDDREWIFTPLLMQRKMLLENCASRDDDHLLDAHGNIRPGRLQEVWFSGAHSDVGGGYADSLLSGVSLNWMIDRLNKRSDLPHPILPAYAHVSEDPFGSSHDPESGSIGLLYHKMSRNIAAYLLNSDEERKEFAGTMCVHESVLQRRRALTLQASENHLLSLQKVGMTCLEPTGEMSNPPRLRQSANAAACPRERQLEIKIWPRCNNMEGMP